MNNFEKLLMVIVPLSGLAMLFYFFSPYAPDIKNSNFQESQRLQGHSYERAATKQTSHQNTYKPKVREKVTTKKAYIKWQSDKTVTQMSQSLKNQKYKQTRQQASYTYPIESYSNQTSINSNRKYQQQIQQRKIKQHQKKIKDQECSYYSQKKEEIRDRMRRKYKASQYNWLEKRRKHWAKLYADNCFSGYRYPG